MEEWGEKSDNHGKDISIAKRFYKTYPKMIPIYSHRYIPMSPNRAGNPIFSIYQTDIIYYGCDLAGYLANEFHFELSEIFQIVNETRHIEFWGDHW